ncbi:MAG TPA: hypothetical protein VF178_01680 [Gemmatimonadaceae bacterium]
MGSRSETGDRDAVDEHEQPLIGRFHFAIRIIDDAVVEGRLSEITPHTRYARADLGLGTETADAGLDLGEWGADENARDGHERAHAANALRVQDRNRQSALGEHTRER